MAKKKIVRKAAVGKMPVVKTAPEESNPVPPTATSTGFESPGSLSEHPPRLEPVASPAQNIHAPKSGKGAAFKLFIILLMFAVVAVLAYYFLASSGVIFNQGSEVDAETFKNSFLSAPTIYIVMDVRGVKDQVISNNVLQCGVDFAASSGMGGKNAVYFSFGDDGCTAPDGAHPLKDCVSQLKNGLVIYVTEGPGGAKYYSNGMIVSVGKEYVLGTCGIRKY